VAGLREKVSVPFGDAENIARKFCKTRNEEMTSVRPGCPFHVPEADRE